MTLMGARRIGTLLLAALLTTGGLAACGDDGDDNGDVALEDIDDNGSNDDSSDDSDDSSDDDSDDSSDIPGGIFGSEECQELFTGLSGLGAAFGSGDDVDFGDFASLFEEMADNAPEIADDLGLLADAYREFAEALDGADLSDPGVLTSPEFAEASEAFAGEEFTEASSRISAFMEETCGTG